MSYVTHMNELCHTHARNTGTHSYKWVMTYTYMDESCHTYECDRPQIYMSPATHINESCHTPPFLGEEWDWYYSNTFVWMSRDKRMNEWGHTRMNKPLHSRTHIHAPLFLGEKWEWYYWHIFVWMSHVTRMDGCDHTTYICHGMHVTHTHTHTHTHTPTFLGEQWDWHCWDGFVCMSHVTRTDACYGTRTSHGTLMSHGTHMRHVTRQGHNVWMHESRHTYECISHVTRRDGWVM